MAWKNVLIVKASSPEKKSLAVVDPKADYALVGYLNKARLKKVLDNEEKQADISLFVEEKVKEKEADGDTN